MRAASARLVCILGALILPLASAELFPLSIIHINDFHARYEPTDTSGGTCDAGEKCIGGYARTVYTVKRLLNEQKDQNAVYFNAGDNFQGTLWYNIGRYNVTSEFLNMLPADAMTLGNHEFDHGIDGVVPFLEKIAPKTPILVANMDSRDEPTMTGKYQSSIIIERSNRKIGVIGIILETTYNLANTGDLIFRNESDTIREEAQKLKSQGANIIIVLTHCGYDVDKLIAQNAGADIDVIVGSHSHTFLFTGDTPPGPDEPRAGYDYPTEVIHESGHRVLIVQAAAYAKYVGNITVFFDDNGNVVDYSGAPIYMGSDVPEDPEIMEALKPWKEIIDVEGNVVVGTSKVELQKSTCSSGECNLGNYFCDSMIHAFAGLAPYEDTPWSPVAIGLVNTGALRVPLTKGNLTYSHLVTMSPFENTLIAFNLPGHKLLEALEYSVAQVDLANNVDSSSVFLQVSGLKVTYDFAQPAGQRVVQVKTRCAACDVPKYEDLDTYKIYRIVGPDFLVNGGDGYSMFSEHAYDLQKEMTDLAALQAYTINISPIYVDAEVVALRPVWRDIVVSKGAVIVGETKVDLSKDDCGAAECSLGNFYSDAVIHALVRLAPYSARPWTNVSIALVASSELYNSLTPGAITYAQIFTLTPYEANLIAFNLSGKHLLEALEHSVASIDLQHNITKTQTFLQVSGLKIVYDLRAPANQRVVEVLVRCAACEVPLYEPLSLEREYRIVVSRYLSNGGLGFSMFSNYGTERTVHITEFQAILDYLSARKPILTGVEGRSRILTT